MKKFLKYATMFAVATAMLPMVSCDDDDTVDPYDINYCYLYQPYETFANVEYKANGDFISGLSDPLEVVPVRLTKAAPTNMQIEVAIDPTIVDEYNEANNTEYTFLEGAEIVNPTLTIAAGEYISADKITVSFTDHRGFINQENNLILPIVIKSAGNAVVSKSSRVFLTFNSTYRANLVMATSVSNLKYMVDTDLSGWQNNKTFRIEDFLTTTWPADAPITIKATIDQSLVDTYNQENDTDFKAIQATLNPSNLIFNVDDASIDLDVNFSDITEIANDEKYLVPVKLSFESGDGARLDEDSEVVYIQLMKLPLELSVSSQQGSLTLITPEASWTGTCNGRDLTAILQSNTSYVNIISGKVLEIDLGSVKNNVKGFGFQFYEWYYGLKDVQDVEVSVDGQTWLNYGGAKLYLEQNQYLTFSKPATFRYMRLTSGDYGYSAGYGCYIKQIKFFN